MSLKPKSKRSHKSIFAYLVMFAVIGYMAFELISTQTAIVKKQSEYDELLTKKEEILIENEQLSRYVDGGETDEYIEEVARDKLDYAFPEERIYYVVPKN